MADMSNTDMTHRLIATILNNDYIEKNLLPKCISWNELRRLLAIDGMATINDIYIYSLELDTKQINDALFGYK